MSKSWIYPGLMLLALTGCSSNKPLTAGQCALITGGVTGIAVGAGGTAGAAVAGVVVGGTIGYLWCDEDDQDNDGVPDKQDLCPNTPAGVEVDSQGCALDSDGDGVPDYLDQCPDTPEGSVVDATGCVPAPAPVPVVVAPVVVTPEPLQISPECQAFVRLDGQGQLAGFGPLLFEFDRSGLTGAHKAQLDCVVSALEQQPGELMLQGHADNQGVNGYNLGLSQRRAQSVESYLLQQEANAELKSEGVGASRPVEDNASEYGRKANRRVEFYFKPDEEK